VNSVREPTAQKISTGRPSQTATATRIDAMIVAAWDDAFAFTFTAACKTAALTRRAL
jgi:hypothetical protein